MTKNEFLASLRTKLSGLPNAELEERLSFYSEMIDDSIEEGESEEVAVKKIGTVESVAEGVLADTPLSVIVKERLKPKRKMNGAEIALLAIGSPIWISLAVAAISVAFSLYVSVWAVIASIWAAFGAFAACAPAGIVATVIFSVTGNVGAGMFVLCGGLMCAGLAIFSFFGCKAATIGTVKLTKNIILSIKKKITNKEAA